MRNNRVTHHINVAPQRQPGFRQQQSSVVVVQQPYPGQAVFNQHKPPDYLCISILVCICCCWPIGICAIYFASRSRELLAQGDVQESFRMAKNARNLIVASAVLGLILLVIVIVLRVLLLY